MKRVSSPKEATLLFFGFARTTVDGRRLLGLLMEDARLMEEDAFGKNCLMMGKLDILDCDEVGLETLGS